MNKTTNTTNEKIDASNVNDNATTLDVITKSNIDAEIMQKINDGIKNGVTARDILKSFLNMNDFDVKFTQNDKNDAKSIIDFCFKFDHDKNDFNINLNAEMREKIIDFASKLIKVDISNAELKKVLHFTALALFGFKFVKRDKTDTLISFTIEKKNVNIRQFLFTFIQSYCFVYKMQMLCIDDKTYLLTRDQFNAIKTNAYKN